MYAVVLAINFYMLTTILCQGTYPEQRVHPVVQQVNRFHFSVMDSFGLQSGDQIIDHRECLVCHVFA